jgi:hypothetical protein
VTAIACDRGVTGGALAERPAIFAAFLRQTIASWMCALLRFFRFHLVFSSFNALRAIFAVLRRPTGVLGISATTQDLSEYRFTLLSCAGLRSRQAKAVHYLGISSAGAPQFTTQRQFYLAT